MSNELYHHGILGMKWGIRRYQNEDGTLTEAGKKRYRNKYVKQMSDEELRSTVNRLSLEKQYLTMTEKPHPILEAGKKIFGSMIYKLAENAAVALTDRLISENSKNSLSDVVDAKANGSYEKWTDKQIAAATKRFENMKTIDKVLKGALEDDDKK